MSRRVVAKKNIPNRVRAWVKVFQGNDIVWNYRKQYHASWSCAIIELNGMGISVSAEDLQKAERRQVGAIASHECRSAKKRGEKLNRELAALLPPVESKAYWLYWDRDDDDNAYKGTSLDLRMEKFEEDEESEFPPDSCVDIDYDPFVD